jgi:sugar phosphate permease
MPLNLKFPYRYRVIVLIYFLVLITYLDRTAISLVGLRIKAAFHLSNTQFGWVLGSFALAYAIFEIPTAVLGDRIGQRKIFLRIVIWWSVFTALTGAVNGLTSLIIVRFLFGAGEAGAFPNCCGVISRWLPATETSKGNAWVSMGASTGAAIAPLIIIPIASAFGWRAPFFVSAAIGMIWVWICYRWFRNHPGEMKKIPGKEKEFIEQNRSFISHHEPFQWRQASRNPMLWALFISYFCIQWANYFFLSWMPNYLQEGKHFSEQEMKSTTSNLFAFAIVSAFLCGVFSDWLVKRKGSRFTRKSIAIISCFFMAVLIFISARSDDHFIVSASMISAYFFLPPVTLTSYSTCVDIGGDRAATIAGIMNFFGQSGSFAMGVIFGKIVDFTHSFEAPQFVMVGVLVTCSICWMGIDASKKVRLLPENPV